MKIKKMHVFLPTVWLWICISFATAMEFDQALLPILTKCNIHIYSHRCPTDEISNPVLKNAVDQELEEEAMKKFSSIDLPYQFTVLPCNTSLRGIWIYLGASQKARCQTVLWFLKPYNLGDAEEYIDVRFSWISWTLYSSRDFTLLIYRKTMASTVLEGLDYQRRFQPENLLVVELESASLDITSAGVIHFYCDEKGATCVDTITFPFHYCSEKGTSDSNQYFRKLAPRSAYTTYLPRNLNRVPLWFFGFPFLDEVFNVTLEIAYLSRLREILVGVAPKFFRQKPKTNHELFEAILQSNVIQNYHLIMAVQLYENQYNLTLTTGRKHEFQTANPFPLVEVLEMLLDEVLGANQYVVQSRYSYMACITDSSPGIDITSIFYPLDKWIWIASFVSYLALALIFRNRVHSPFFLLLAPVFGQSAEISVKRFSYLLLIWTFFCLLASNLYSSFIGSFLVAPPALQPVNEYEDLYKMGYKLLESSHRLDGYNDSDIKVSAFKISTGGTHPQSPYARKRFKYLLKMFDEMEISWGNTSISPVLSFTSKSCYVQYDGEQRFAAMVANLPRNHTGFLMKEPLGQLFQNWKHHGPYGTVLATGLRIFFASGIMHVIHAGEDIALNYAQMNTFNRREREINPYHVDGVFFSIVRDESPHLFSFRYEPSRLVFYIWASLTAFALLVFLISSLVRWKARIMVLITKVLRTKSNITRSRELIKVEPNTPKDAYVTATP